MRKRFFVAALAVAVLLTGCTNVPDLSRVHNNIEAEYMAGLMLKYDANYDEMLDYDRSILNPTPTPEPTRTPVARQSGAASGTSVAENQNEAGTGEGSVETYITMEEMGTIQGITLSQQTYELRKSYGSDYAVVDAEDGNRLLVVKFRMKNGTTGSKKVNMPSANMSYSLEIDGESMGNAIRTLLPDDLQNYYGKIPAGKSREAVLIFKISQTKKVKNASLYVSNGKQTAQISLK